MKAYIKLRNKIDSKLKQISENPENLLDKVKLADVILIIGFLFIGLFILNLITSLTRLLFIWV